MSDWLIFGNEKIAHHGLNDYCERRNIIMRNWSVYQDVGRIPLCKKCMAKIRKQNKILADKPSKAMQALYRQLAIDTAAGLSIADLSSVPAGDPFDTWRPAK